MLALKQPAQRLLVTRATFVALALLGPLVAICRSTRAAQSHERAELTRTNITADLCCCPASTASTPSAALNDSRPAVMVGIFAGGSGLAIGWLMLGAIASM